MLDPQHFAVTFARAVDVLHSRAAVSDRKAALRALVALTKLAPATLTLANRVVSVDGTAIPRTLPSIPLLIRQLGAHAVTEIRIAQEAAAPDLLGLLRGLAADPADSSSDKTIAHTLRASRAQSVSVLVVEPEQKVAGRQPASVTQAFEAAGIAEAAGGAAAAGKSTAEELALAKQEKSEIERELDTLRKQLAQERRVVERLRQGKLAMERRAVKAETKLTARRGVFAWLFGKYREPKAPE